MFIKYLKYLIKHKYYVTVECFKRGLYWRGITHDLSKFLPDEFIPYMNFFYGKFPSRKDILSGDGKAVVYKYKEIVKEEFNIAWLHHQHRNPHHWQWWVLRNDNGPTEVFEMPLQYRAEMLCDWHGAGKAIMGKNSNTKEWYIKNKDKMILGDATRCWIESELGIE